MGDPEHRDVTIEARSSSRPVRAVASALLALVLGGAVWLQRGLLGDALHEVAGLSVGAMVVLFALAVYERWSRADIMQRLLNGSMVPASDVDQAATPTATTRRVSLRRAVFIHDIGNAVSKAVPLGGAVGTAVRWTITKQAEVSAPRFATTLVGYGIATTFASWMLPFVALSADLTQRPADPIDWLILAGIGAVIVTSAVFWLKVLNSDGLERWSTTQLRTLWHRAGQRIRSLGGHDPAAGVAEVRTELRALIRRPWRLIGLTVLSQGCGSLILLVALRSLGVGVELGLTEFFRIFFLVTLLGSFSPTPGGVGAIEAGLTGALIAAGVDAPSALAGVIVYRFLVYLVPIIVGAVAYGVWRLHGGRAPAQEAYLTSVGSV